MHPLHCVKGVRIRVILVRMPKNVDQNNSKYGQFLRSALTEVKSHIFGIYWNFYGKISKQLRTENHFLKNNP